VIPEAETRSLAAVQGVDPMVVDLDYALGWLLSGLFLDREIRGRWVFKGGTCLRKCWFPGYRFSEDLDFTVNGNLEVDAVRHLLEAPIAAVAELSGIDLMASESRYEIDFDEYGKETVKVRLYHRSTIRRSGSPPAVQIHLSGDEIIALPTAQRVLSHPYSDASSMPVVQIPCYSLEEVLAEKIRAVGGQRRFAIARDIFDIHHLVSTGLDISPAISILTDKFAIKSLSVSEGMVERFVNRKADYRLDWSRRVENLETGGQTNFDVAFQTVRELLEHVVNLSAA